MTDEGTNKLTRKEALAIFEDNDTVIENPNYLFTEIGEAWDMAIEALKEERPHGEWLTQWQDTCSQCKKEFDVPTGDNCKALWNYCPNCGADMRKEGEAE